MRNGPQRQLQAVRVGRIGKTGRILSFDWQDLTRGEAEAAVKGSTLSIIPLADVLAMSEDQQEKLERHMGDRASQRYHQFKRDTIAAKWPNGYDENYDFRLALNRRVKLWIILYGDGGIADITTSETAAGHFLESYGNGRVSAYCVEVKVPKTKTIPVPPAER
jgi:hypothetical protein